MNSKSSHSYFLTPKVCNPYYPLFIFLPGMDETGKELVCIQTRDLEVAFDVRCFIVPPANLKNCDQMAEEVLFLTEIELAKKTSSDVYLCGESFGCCLALKVLQKYPDYFTKIILINSASSFNRVPWLNFGSILFAFIPNFVYKISSFVALLFLAHLSKLSPTARQALLNSTRSAPKKTANQRLTIMREFNMDEKKLSQITQPVLLIVSFEDRLLPSVAEGQRLNKIFPNSDLIILPHSGHACLVEDSVNLYKLLLAHKFI
ncbi:alpha/beta hydrolase [Calothrix sp. HK-06]|nr:alpha/beta hydrolase [Calothrix sp. HK-06]